MSAFDVLVAAPGATARGAVVRGAGVFAVAVGAGGSAISTVTRVPASALNTPLLLANLARRGATFYNSSPAGANLYLKLGAGASLVAGVESYTVRLVPNAYYEAPFGYNAQIDGIWDAADANGECLVDELT